MYVSVNFHFKYPFLYLFSAFAAGIVSSEYFIFTEWFLFVPFTLACLCVRKFKLATDCLLLISIFAIGQELSSHTIPEYSKNVPYRIKSRCEEILPRHHYILSAGQQKFYLNNSYTDTLYSPGDSLSFYARITIFHNRVNPGEFNYAHYLRQKKVYCQVFPLTPIVQKGHSEDIASFFYHCRRKLMEKTSLLTQDSICRQLINALCLGYKTDLDNATRNLFITTGTVHLLSVSGLHTGAIYVFLLFIVRHLGLTRRKTEILLLPLLWSYACLTGLSPSVVRASTILSFITVGKVFCRTYTPLNSLAAAAFFTLLIQPTSLYSISFLLSYSAYAGILIFYPFLLRLPGTLPPIVSQIYACCCITIAAQIPTLPLSAFYFHTVNINSFLINLLAVPLATLFLYISACSLLLPLFVGQYLGLAGEFLCNILVRLLQLFSPYSLHIRHLYPSVLCIVLLYALLITIGGYLFFRKRHWLFASIGTCTLLLFHLLLTNIRLTSGNEVVIFHYPRQSVILLNHKGFGFYLQNTLPETRKTPPYLYQYKLKTLPTGTGVLDKELFYHSHLLTHPKDTIIILSRMNSTYNSCNTLIVTDNLLPANIFPSFGHTMPQRVILDGSNTLYTLTIWASFCREHQIFLQNTAENGTIRLLLK
ncbi:MAG: ComEC family competence protein [Odoribacter sp.]|nr:ComEC family competence protein [Odoribacter sp.]